MKWRADEGFAVGRLGVPDRRTDEDGSEALVLCFAALALFHVSLPSDWHAFGMAGFSWLRFIMPAQVSAVIFGGTAPRWVMAKILISTGGSLACIMGAAAVFHLMQ